MGILNGIFSSWGLQVKTPFWVLQLSTYLDAYYCNWTPNILYRLTMTYDTESKLTDLVVPSRIIYSCRYCNMFYSFFWRSQLTSLTLEYSLLRSARNHWRMSYPQAYDQNKYSLERKLNGLCLKKKKGVKWYGVGKEAKISWSHWD